jgi:hypothetical protein
MKSTATKVLIALVAIDIVLTLISIAFGS